MRASGSLGRFTLLELDDRDFGFGWVSCLDASPNSLLPHVPSFLAALLGFRTILC